MVLRKCYLCTVVCIIGLILQEGEEEMEEEGGGEYQLQPGSVYTLAYRQEEKLDMMLANCGKLFLRQTRFNDFSTN